MLDLLKKKLPKKPAPRPAKYAWAAAVSALLLGSVAFEAGSAWLPLINQAIDLLQRQEQQGPPVPDRLNPGP